MTATLLIVAIGLCATSGAIGLFFDRTSAAGERLSTALLVLGSIAGIVAAGAAFVAPVPPTLSLPWSVPGGELSVRIDAVAALFLIPIFAVPLLGSVYGLGYWGYGDRPESGRRLRLFYGVLAGAMAMVVSADNTLLFLAAWEVMALAAFFCVTTEDTERPVREAGYLYLVAAHLCTLTLFVLLAVLHLASGTFRFEVPPGLSPGLSTAIFVLALVAFGTKAGLMPLHFWLPSAHAIAPSHVSAVLSGVLLKIGIYGLVRVLGLFPHPPTWWGGLVLGLGTASALLGVAFAVGQHDVKRLLAYHSVENIGIICMGLGLAVLGRAKGSAELMALGLGAALLHVWNHSLFKSLLFLSAGAVVHVTGTREIDRLGGLMKKMPWTGSAFLVGAVAICGLPPLNGFVSEILLYLGLFRSVLTQEGGVWTAGALGAPALALVGGLALACFVKVVGAVFLGVGRSEHAARAHEATFSMLGPMGVLVACCAVIGLAPALFAPALNATVGAWAPDWAGVARIQRLAPFNWLSVASGAVVLFIGSSGALLHRRLHLAPGALGTWDCGYAQPAPSMQYTASSFADTLVRIFGWALFPRSALPRMGALFPQTEAFHSDVPDVVLDRVLAPGVNTLGRALAWIRWSQHGSVHAYLAYVLLALLVLFFLK